MNKCEKCGGLHYRLDPCSYRRTANSELLGSTDVTSNPDQKQDASDSLGSGPTIASAKAPKFDKTAYMKTYMVKWRKRQKERRSGK